MRRWRSGILLCAIGLAVHAASATAQTYPNRTIRMVVGFTPGGGADIIARLLASTLPDLLGQQVIVENRPGAATNIANELVAKSAPDGYTLLIYTSVVAINMSLYKKLPYDTLRDFAPISVFAEWQNVLVVSNEVARGRCRSWSRARVRSPACSTMHRRAAVRPSTWAQSCSSCAPTRTSCTCRTRGPRRR